MTTVLCTQTMRVDSGLSSCSSEWDCGPQPHRAHFPSCSPRSALFPDFLLQELPLTSSCVWGGGVAPGACVQPPDADRQPLSTMGPEQSPERQFPLAPPRQQPQHSGQHLSSWILFILSCIVSAGPTLGCHFLFFRHLLVFSYELLQVPSILITYLHQLFFCRAWLPLD